MAEDLCRKRKPEKALPYIFKAMKDPNNLDAIIQMAFVMPTMETRIRLLEEGAAKGDSQLSAVHDPHRSSNNFRTRPAPTNSGAHLLR